MNREELRARAIETMGIAAFERIWSILWKDADEKTRSRWIIAFLAAFDALHGVVRVVPMEATEEMLQQSGPKLYNHDKLRFSLMAAAGDLTNKPKK